MARTCASRFLSGSRGHSIKGVAFFIAPSGRKGGVMADESVMTPEMTPQGDSLPPDNIVVVSEEDAAKAVEGLEA
nr:MAG TPA: hypothetical protein [Caudoviricetes sp.]DAH86033.1 MAG TPA: hypothetical protein [Caudoviricetes sp.]